MTVLYAGIDVSKDKFDVSFTTDGKRIFNYAVFINEKKGIKSFFKKALGLMKKENCNKIHFVMESTGIYHCGLCEYLQEHSDHIVSVINPVQTKSFSKSLMLRTKNDKVDSSMSAQYGFYHNPKPTPKMPETLKHFRSLVRLRDALIEERTRKIAQLKSSLDKRVQNYFERSIKFTEKEIEKLENEIKELIKNDDYLNRQISLLKTVDAIGDTTAWKLLSEVKVNAENINPKAQAANAGLTPREFSSGSSVRGRTHISRMGNRSIRKSLYLPALSCIKNRNYFYGFYNRLVENGKPKKSAVTAVMRKILVTAMGVLKNQQPFAPDWAEKTRKEYEKNLKKA